MTQPFQFTNGQLAYNADDLIALCQQYPDDGTNYLVREDLEKWLTYIGNTDLAQCATSARQTEVADRQKLEEFLHKCHALSSPKTAEIKTIKETLSVEETKAEVFQPSITENKVNMPEEKTKLLEATQKTPESKYPAKVTNVTSQVKTEGKTPTISANTNVKKEKPSFFKLIAGLIINIFYRDKN